ncbi:hypothetical protein GGF46_000606 [Coemansia sp. RSA 552]|nr:hypothetical protein GGF46_000606 [Coemansia sp. RSA 552]
MALGDPIEAPLFLGLDLSTQQLKGLLVDSQLRVEREISVVFGDELTSYKTNNGRHVCGDTVTAPVLMWAEALDLLMSKLAQSGLASRVCGISGAAQQHGSVYWKNTKVLEHLDPETSLKAQLEHWQAFALPDSPIWEDSSTGKQCRRLEDCAGGPQELARISGSFAFERFTGPQIMKVKETQPGVWSQVKHISLVSSFAASLLAGRVASVDVADASGTNLYDMNAHVWSEQLCASIEPRLASLLGAQPVAANTVVGQVSPYFSQKYGIPQCPVLAFTGDNPSAFAGFESMLAASRGSDDSIAMLSLGTSDTLLFPLSEYPYSPGVSAVARQHLDGHILQHPTRNNQWIAMFCYKNGSLARDWVRERAPGATSTWAEFSRAAEAGPLAPAAFGFYYPMTEIQPHAKGIYRFERVDCGDIAAPSGARYSRVEAFSDPAGHMSDARAIIESQLLSMRADYAHKSTSALSNVAITGGASENLAIQQALADVLGVSVFAAGVRTSTGFVMKTPAMPAYGGAIRALSSSCRGAIQGGGKGAYELQCICRPDPARHAVYTQVLPDFEYLRDHVCQISEQ